MLGFATVDSREKDVLVVWLTSQVEPTRAEHTNAVSIKQDDPGCWEKFDALTGNRTVVLTRGSVAPPSLAHAVPTDLIEGFAEETHLRQDGIRRAVRDWRTQLVEPTLPVLPSSDDYELEAEAPVRRTLETANYLARVWSAWLETEAQRVRKSVDPRTGKPPWIMPEELAGPLEQVPASLDLGWV